MLNEAELSVRRCILLDFLDLTSGNILLELLSDPVIILTRRVTMELRTCPVVLVQRFSSGVS